MTSIDHDLCRRRGGHILPQLGVLAVVMFVFVPRSAAQDETAPSRETRDILPRVPEKWAVSFEDRPGHEGGILSVFDVDETGKLLHFSRNGRSKKYLTPDSYTEKSLTVHDRENVLHLVGDAVESLAFEPPLSGMWDTEAATVSLDAPRQKVEVVVLELGERAHGEIKKRLERLAIVAKGNAGIDRYPKRARPLTTLMDVWKVTMKLEIGKERIEKISIQGLGRTEPTRSELSTRVHQPLVSVEEFRPGMTEPVSKFSHGFIGNEQEKAAASIVAALSSFSIRADQSATEGPISFSLQIEAKPPGGGNSKRSLSISESKLTTDEFAKSIGGSIVRYVNEIVPEENRVRWE